MTIEQMFAKLADVAERYGPHVAELGAAVGRVAAADTIVRGIVLLIISLGALGAAVYFGRRAKITYDAAQLMKEYDKKIDAEGSVIPWILCSVVASFAFFLVFVPSVFRLTNIYAWVGIFRPEVYLAARALGFT